MEQTMTDSHSQKSWTERSTESIQSAYDHAKNFAANHLVETSIGAGALIGVGLVIASRGRLMGTVAKYFPDGASLLEDGAEKGLATKGMGNFTGDGAVVTSSLHDESRLIPKLSTVGEESRDQALVAKLPVANTLNDLNNLAAKYNTTGPTLHKITTTFGLDLELPAQNKIAELSESDQLKVSLMQKLKKRIAGHENTQPETLSILANDSSPDVKYFVADNKNTSPATLDKLAEDSSSSLRNFVAGRERTSAETLAKLSDDRDPLVRANVAANDSTSPETIAKLGSDENWLVQLFLARRADASPAMLEKLGSGTDSKVNVAVALHENTTPETLAKLAKDEDWEVRAAVAENKNTSRDTLAPLTGDTEIGEFARHRALDRFNDLLGN